MGLFGKIRGSDSKTEEERIVFSELPAWLSNKRAGMESDLEKKLESHKKKTRDVAKELGEKLEALRKANVSKDMIGRIDSIVTSSRDNYASGMLRALEDIHANAKALEFAYALRTSLVAMKELDLKYGERVNYGFHDQLSKVKKVLNGLVDLSNDTKAASAGIESANDRLIGIENELSSANSELAKITSYEARKKCFVEDVEVARSEISRKEAEIHRLESSDRAERVKVMKTEVEGLKGKKQEIENAMLNVLGPLKRVFKLYARAVSDGKVSGPNAGKYAEDPISTYLRGDNTLPELFAGMLRALQTGLLETDQVEIDKTLKKIRNISFTYIEKLRSEYTTIVSNLRSLEVKIAELDVSKESERLLRDIDNLNDKLLLEAKEIEKLENDAREEGGRLNGLKMDLAAKLSEFTGHRVEIV